MFVTPAYAQAGESPGILPSLLPLVLIFAIIYFLMIRPQQKKMKQHQAMLAAIKRGDQIVTGGGVVGKVTRIREGEELEVEIAEGVRVRVMRATVASVLARTDVASRDG